MPASQRVAALNGETMAHRKLQKIAAMAVCVAQASALCPSPAWAQSASDLVGTWSLVSSVTDKDGMRSDQFGAGAKGKLILDATGQFMLTIIGPDLPKFASNNRAAGTPEENKAVVSRSIAMIGNYAVNALDKTLTFTVESATFANWNGTQQKRLLSPIEGDVLRYVTPTASSGGVGIVTWQRVR
jgi:hypothetical protein